MVQTRRQDIIWTNDCYGRIYASLHLNELTWNGFQDGYNGAKAHMKTDTYVYEKLIHINLIYNYNQKYVAHIQTPNLVHVK